MNKILRKNKDRSRAGNRPSGGHHDIFFKACYSSPACAFELFQLAFSKKELAAFDWRRLKSEKDSFEDKRADLVFSVPLKNKPGKKARIFFLLEHKSRFSRWIYHQILKYKTFIIGESLKRGEDDCLVIAVLFYHGKRPWKWPKSLKKGLWSGILPEIPSSLEKDVVNYGIRLVDAHGPRAKRAIADRGFKSRGFLSALKRAWDLKPDEGELSEALSLFDSWTGDRDDLALNVGSYFRSSVPGMTKKLWERIEREAVRKGIFSKGGSMNIREYIKEEGLQEGLQKGMRAGMRKGIQKGHKEVALNMLNAEADMAFIAKVTGLSEREIRKLKNGG